jgi:1,4-dihydroxy-2-naphthoyl-CoA hydrolase
MININIPLDQVNAMNKNTMMEHLGIVYTKITEQTVEGKMPVDHRTHQPMGLLHGGATAALIESLGSVGSALCVDLTKQHVVGIEINVNHLKSAKKGFVNGIAKLIHEGKSTHVWQVDVYNDENKLVGTGRLTVLVKNIKQN